LFQDVLAASGCAGARAGPHNNKMKRRRRKKEKNEILSFLYIFFLFSVHKEKYTTPRWRLVKYIITRSTCQQTKTTSRACHARPFLEEFSSRKYKNPQNFKIQ
jgi:hypothetical protein